MDYRKTYDRLIQKRRDNPISRNECYCERHHIVPKSEGGSDDDTNLVNLTAREHYIAHLLLARIYDDFKMWYALNLLTSVLVKNGQRVNSRMVALAREGTSESRRSQWADEEYRKSVIDNIKRSLSKPSVKEHHVKAIREANLNPEYREHRSAAQKGRLVSDSTKDKIRDATRRQFSDKEKRDRHRNACLVVNTNPEFRRLVSDTLRRFWSDDKNRKKMSETKKEFFRNNPDASKQCAVNTGRFWFNDGTRELFATECPSGFVRGRLKKFSESKLGCHWFNNGIENKFAPECPPGFVSGRLNLKKGK